MYEGSGRYKDVRELYESKLEAKDTELMSAKEQVLQAKIREEQQEKEFAKQMKEAQESAKEN